MNRLNLSASDDPRYLFRSTAVALAVMIIIAMGAMSATCVVVAFFI